MSLIKNPGPNVGDPEGGDILPGQTKMGTLTVADLDAFAFSANAGDTVTVLMERGSSGFVSPRVELHAPDGTVVDSASGSGSATIQARRLNQTGTYLIVCRASGSPGEYWLSFSLSPGSNNQPLWVDVFGREQLRIGRWQSYTVRYGNSSTTNLYDVLLYVRLPRNTEYRVRENRPTLAGVDWSTMPQGHDDGSGILVPVWIYQVPASSSQTIDLEVRIQPGAWSGGQAFRVGAEVRRRDSEFASTGDLALLSTSPNFADFRQSLGQAIEGQGGTITSQETFDLGIRTAFGNLLIDGGFATLGTAFTVGLWEAAALGCISPWIAVGATLVLTVSSANDLFHDIMQLYRAVFDAFLGAHAVGSWDPNAKAGPVGFGGERFVSGRESLPYTIFFENMTNATAAAQEVLITERLDARGLDLNTLELGPVVFGARQIVPPPGMRSFSTNVDLRPVTNLVVQMVAGMNATNGIVSWHFTAIDPVTGLPPTDPLAGFLPPNRTPPEGEGSVSFTIMPKQSLATGTLITNGATIIFDVNPAIATATWTNRFDNTKPTSQVVPLATNEFAPFQVRWSGADAGAGIRDYTIYVSDNYGAFVPWLVNTTNTSALFPGEANHTCAFFSLARDDVGNQEDSPSLTAFTTVMPLFLSIGRVQNSVVLSWPTDAVGFALETAEGVTSEGSWMPVAQPPWIMGNQNVVTNDTTGPMRFYRLKRTGS